MSRLCYRVAPPPNENNCNELGFRGAGFGDPSVASLRGRGYAVAIGDPLTQHRGHARARGDDPREVERIAGGEPDGLAAGRLAPDGAQRLQRFGRGELLPDESAHHAPASQLPAHLETAVHAQEITPGGGPGLALQDLAEDDAVAPHVLAGGGAARGG